MKLRQGMTALMVSAALLGLSACEDSKDRAARHLASALELAEKGDGDRAVVEFRNVFKLDPENLDARRAFAAFLEGRGDKAGAFAQYQNLIDRNPADQVSLRAAALIAADLGNWEQAGRHAAALLALVPADGPMLAIQAAKDYAEAFARGDAAARSAAAARAATLLESQPDNLTLHRVVVDSLAQSGDFPAALTALDRALALEAKDRELYQMRVSLLAALDDKAGVEAELLKMTGIFPDDPAVSESLLRWYIGNGQLDQAEAWMRQAAQGTTQKALETRVALIAFLQKFRSPEAALAEIEAALKDLPAAPAATEPAEEQTATEKANAKPEATGPRVTAAGLRTLRASILFDGGQRDAAVTELKEVLAAAQPSEETRNIKVTLARMYLTLADQVQSRALVEEVLAEDPGQVEAIKLKAAWLTEDDKVDEAIALLRTALDGAPRDAQVMGLMADAYGRAGSRDLQADMLSQAVAASGKAPFETLRYASFLVGDQKYLPAETILVDALRLDPANLDLLAAMGELYLAMKDWPRAEGVVNRLTEIGSPAARAIADQLAPLLLANRDSVGSAVEYLQGLAAGSDDIRAKATLLSAYLANGQEDEAKALAAEMLTAAPQDPAARFASAAVKGATGDGAGAITDYRALLAENPAQLNVWIALIRQVAQDQGQPAAEPVVDEALVALPDQGDLLFMKANLLEARQDIDGAIAVYETLYAANSNNIVVANNLASLISSYRSDKESLDRAWAVARRLNGTQEPALADTYGWLAHLRGQSAEALPYLELAAAGLPQDPLVQFHLAEVLAAQGEADRARAAYERVLELVGEGDSRAFVASARKALAPPSTEAASGTAATQAPAAP